MKKGLKLASVLTASVMLLSSLSLPVIANAESREQNGGQLVKQWSFESGAEGWQVGKLVVNETETDTMANFRVIDGTIRADAITTQNDPQFTTSDLTSEDITLGDGTENKPNYIKIRMKNHSGIADEGKVFFMTGEDTNFSSGKAKSFPINMNQSDFTDVYLKMSDVSGWTGKLKALRIDPVDKVGMDSSKGGTFIIDEVSLYAIPEPETKMIVSQTFDTTYTKETNQSDWWRTYLKDSNGNIMARAAVSGTEIEQKDNALNIKFSASNQRVDILGPTGNKDTTGRHRVSVKIKNNGSSQATVHLNAIGAKDAAGKDYDLFMNQSINVGEEKTITFDRDFYEPSATSNAILIQSANACDITVDDVTLIKEDKLALSPLSQIHEGAENVDVSGAYGLLFNYAVKGGHTQYTHLGLNESGQANIKIYEKGQTTEVASVNYAVGSGAYAQFCIKPDSALKYNTEYTLKLGVVNTSDNSQSLKNLAVNFKTKAEPKMMGVDSNGKETTVLANTTKIKYKAGSEILGGCIATYKNGVLTGVKGVPILANAETDGEIALSNVSTINDADTVKAFLWNADLEPAEKALVLK